VFESAVDRFGGAVGGAGPVEVGQDIGGAAGQGAAEPVQFDESGRDTMAQAVDQCPR